VYIVAQSPRTSNQIPKICAQIDNMPPNPYHTLVLELPRHR